jgi:5-methylcytosine-specific restriction enzyme A
MGVRLVKPRVKLIAPRLAAQGPAAPAPSPTWGRGRGGRPWRRLRQRILERDGYLCQACQREGQLTLATEVDHIRPLFLGGTDDERNLEGICRRHHEAKRQAEVKLARRMTV